MDDASNPARKNPDRHPLLAELMRPYEAAGLPLRVREICTAAGIDSIKGLGKWPNNKPCWRWLLGECRERCPQGSDHLQSAEVDADRAKALCAKLAPGIKKLISADVERGTPPSKRQKTGGGK